jgi:hypothetical protein
MEEILLFIEERQTWIYVILTLAGLVYLRSIFHSYKELRGSIFSLERERAMSRLIRSGAMLILVFAGLAATFVVATFAWPALSVSIHQTPIPTVSLLATLEVDSDKVVEESLTTTPRDSLIVDSSGCLNPMATITDPQGGDSVSGLVVVLGVANITNFAFYKIEYKRLMPGEVWHPISADTQPVCEDGCQVREELGTWNTTLVTPGEYAFRLVVMDAEGNAPLPCEIQLRVLPPP